MRLRRRSTAVPRRIAGVAVALAAAALVQGPCNSEPVLIDLTYRYAVGDAYTADRRVSRSYEASSSIEGGEPEETSGTTSDHFVYRQAIDAIAPDGRPTKATRRYSLAQTVSTPAGSRSTTATRRLQGRTFEIAQVGTEAKAGGIEALDDADRLEIAGALVDEYAYAVESGPRRIGETWPLPTTAAMGLYANCTCKGTCTLKQVTQHAGLLCAHLVANGEVQGVDSMGRAVTTRMTGYLLWSMALKRVIECGMSSTTTTEFRTNHGASVVNVVSTGKSGFVQENTWTAVAGRRVKMSHSGSPKRGS